VFFSEHSVVDALAKQLVVIFDTVEMVCSHPVTDFIACTIRSDDGIARKMCPQSHYPAMC